MRKQYSAELKTHIYRFDNVSDECNGSSRLDQLNDFSQFTLPSTTPFLELDKPINFVNFL